uniref:ice-binding family protein n=1 Tax=Persicitalea sp. TaxID=3100273 RepID=UPI00359492BE
TLTPGVYCQTGPAAATDLTGVLTLDGGGDPNAVFIIKLNGAFSTATGSSILLTNGASAANVFFQVNGAVILGISSTFSGTIIANGAISLLTGASLLGRALSLGGAINLDTNVVNVPPPAPLPVSLVSFNAQKEAQTAVLSWATAEEVNSDRFEVEHSLNGKTWQMIGKVAAKGDTNDKQWYSFTDVNPANGSNLYRLRIVDRDGTFDYSRLKSLEFDINIETALYPNPVSERLLLKTDDLKKISRVEFYNSMGIAVMQSDSVPNSGLDVKNLPTGLYVVKVTRTNGSTYTFKVLKQ